SHVRLQVCMEIALRSQFLESASSRPLAIDSLVASANIPSSRECKISGTPPTRVATTGVPQASDSVTTFGHPSRSLARQLTSAALNQEPSSSLGLFPINHTRSCSPNSFTSASSVRRHG